MRRIPIVATIIVLAAATVCAGFLAASALGRKATWSRVPSGRFSRRPNCLRSRNSGSKPPSTAARGSLHPRGRRAFGAGTSAGEKGWAHGACALWPTAHGPGRSRLLARAAIRRMVGRRSGRHDRARGRVVAANPPAGLTQLARPIPDAEQPSPMPGSGSSSRSPRSASMRWSCGGAGETRRDTEVSAACRARAGANPLSDGIRIHPRRCTGPRFRGRDARRSGAGRRAPCPRAWPRFSQGEIAAMCGLPYSHSRPGSCSPSSEIA